MKLFRTLFCLSLVCLTISACSTGLATRQTIMERWKRDFDDSKGYVYIYRKSSLWGAIRALHVQEGRKRICSLNSGTCFIYEVAPGQYTFAAEDNIRAEEYLTVDVKAGEKVYIKAELKMDVLDVKPQLSLVKNESEIDFSRLDRVAGTTQ